MNEQKIVEKSVPESGLDLDAAKIAKELCLRTQVLAHTSVLRCQDAKDRWPEVTRKGLAEMVIQALPQNSFVWSSVESDQVLAFNEEDDCRHFLPSRRWRRERNRWVNLAPRHIRFRSSTVWPEDQAERIYSRPLPAEALGAIREALQAGCFDQIRVAEPRIETPDSDPFLIGVVNIKGEERLFLLYRWDAGKIS